MPIVIPSDDPVRDFYAQSNVTVVPSSVSWRPPSVESRHPLDRLMRKIARSEKQAGPLMDPVEVTEDEWREAARYGEWGRFAGHILALNKRHAGVKR